MKIEYTPVRELRAYPNNARTHSRKQLRQIANSIKKFGFCNPVLIDGSPRGPGGTRSFWRSPLRVFRTAP
jgi:ParB-like chromosome segregation protein Spo0J